MRIHVLYTLYILGIRCTCTFDFVYTVCGMVGYVEGYLSLQVPNLTRLIRERVGVMQATRTELDTLLSESLTLCVIG